MNEYILSEFVHEPMGYSETLFRLVNDVVATSLERGEYMFLDGLFVVQVFLGHSRAPLLLVCVGFRIVDGIAVPCLIILGRTQLSDLDDIGFVIGHAVLFDHVTGDLGGLFGRICSHDETGGAEVRAGDLIEIHECTPFTGRYRWCC